MNWLGRFVNRESPVPEEAGALRDWLALPVADPTRAHFETRYCVVNTESTGLDLERDQLLSVAAVAVDGGLLDPAQSCYARLEPDPDAALREWLVFVGKGPLVVFNAGFNRGMLERALSARLGIETGLPWIDLYFVLPALFPERISAPVRLGDWLNIFGIETLPQHRALGDAWAIGQLFLAVQARGLQNGAGCARALIDIERNRRQLWRHT